MRNMTPSEEHKLHSVPWWSPRVVSAGNQALVAAVGAWCVAALAELNVSVLDATASPVQLSSLSLGCLEQRFAEQSGLSGSSKPQSFLGLTVDGLASKG